MTETTDRMGRIWNLRPEELCPVCGQPDNCGDCNHVPLNDEQVIQLGGKLPGMATHPAAKTAQKWSEMILPNDKVGRRTVVASCPFDEWILVLLLNEASPFFSVAQVVSYTGSGQNVPGKIHFDYTVLAEETHFNIVPAVRAYEQWGGDY